MIAIGWLLIGPLLGVGQAAELNVIEDFASGEGGWQGEGPVVVDSGGPDGQGDAYLQLQSFGGNRPGSRLAIFNRETRWMGDFSQVGAVEMDLLNPIETGEDIAIRLVLFGPESTNNRFTSITPEIIPADGQWKRVTFPVDASQLTSVLGDATYDQLVADVVRIMIRHDADEPGAGGDRVVATMGVDNLVLRPIPEPTSMRLLLLGCAAISFSGRRTHRTHACHLA